MENKHIEFINHILKTIRFDSTKCDPESISNIIDLLAYSIEKFEPNETKSIKIYRDNTFVLTSEDENKKLVIKLNESNNIVVGCDAFTGLINTGNSTLKINSGEEIILNNNGVDLTILKEEYACHCNMVSLNRNKEIFISYTDLISGNITNKNITVRDYSTSICNISKYLNEIFDNIDKIIEKEKSKGK